MTYEEFQELPQGEVVFDASTHTVWHKAFTAREGRKLTWEAPGRTGYFHDVAVYKPGLTRVGNTHG